MIEREHVLTDDTPCIGCKKLVRASAIEGTGRVMLTCSGECPEYEQQVEP